MRQRIIMYAIEEPTLLVEHTNGPRYQNQCGGVTCMQEELESFLCPLDVSPEGNERIENAAYTSGGPPGISVQVADLIDAVLGEKPSTAFVTVDRTRLSESQEAWVFVLVDSPAEGEPQNPQIPLYGFGRTRGVLTWMNSD
jgi:hypothetical protein